MKLITLMALNHQKNDIRKIFAEHDVQIYSEVEITGHTSETIKQHGWWVFERDDIAMYSILYFSVVPKEKSDEIMQHIKKLQTEEKSEFPPRAFQVNVEKMV